MSRFYENPMNQPTKPTRYIPAGASGAARSTQTGINNANIAAGRTPGASRTTPSRTGQTLGNTQPAPVPTPTTQTQQRAAVGPYQDAAYNAQIASIQRALADFETGATTRGERYGQDYMTGLRGLGYRPGEGFQAMPNVLEQLDKPQPTAMAALSDGAAPAVDLAPVSGQFDIEGQYDPYSAAAQGTRSRRDDFAARGTLRSSDFAKTFGQFQDRLQQQLDAMETSRTRFGQDLATDVAQQRTASQERQQGAQRDAMLRAAMAAGRSF
jgi:hypothetical protein